MDEGEGFKVSDLGLADEGALRVDWARSRMPVLATLLQQASQTKPLSGMRVAGCLHVTKETAVLIETLVAAGAEVSWSGCNPLSTQDDVAAWLAREGYAVYAWHGQSTEDFYHCIDQTIDFAPTLTLEDRKSIRLNSSHVVISYAVFCFKKKKNNIYRTYAI
mgnify:CR=1 FL=1